MKVSLSWLGVFLISCVILFIIVDATRVYEAFKVPQVTEGFQEQNNFTLTSCPAASTSYIDSVGRTMCCKGDIVNGKCSTNPICSLSESAAGVPTCQEWYMAYLREKGRDMCPPSMSFYFEKDGKRGCASSTDTASKKCILYNSIKEENKNTNSCTNVKLLETEQCFFPEIPSNKSFFDMRGLNDRFGEGLPQLISCSVQIPGQMSPGMCYTDKSFRNFLKALGNLTQYDWINNLGSGDKAAFCSIYKQIYIDKTKTFADVGKMKVP
jgi:hypothetical protein